MIICLLELHQLTSVADFLESTSKLDGSTRRVPIAPLWAALIEGLSPIWPATRTNFGGVSLGDVWPCAVLQASAKGPGDDLVPFHKLTGWITYSLVEPMEKILGWKFEGLEDMTGLPEYRNGLSPSVLSPKELLFTSWCRRSFRRPWRVDIAPRCASKIPLPKPGIPNSSFITLPPRHCRVESYDRHWPVSFRCLRPILYL